jgi:predicted outer membrane repeat protein
VLGVIRDDYSFNSLGVFVGPQRLACTEVNGEIYFCNNTASGVITVDDECSRGARPAGKVCGSRR